MDPHSVATWITIINKLPSPLLETVEQTIANRILGDMVGYRHNSQWRKRDIDELANAIQAARVILDNKEEGFVDGLLP
jgi:hypothetical protein